MSRVFLSHSNRDRAPAVALQAWLERAEPGLAGEIFLDVDPDSGVPAGKRWKEALRRANERCEAVICLLSRNWDDSYECKVEYRAAEDQGKPIFPVRLEPFAGDDITAEWQRCDLFGDGPKTSITVEDHAEPVEFLTDGLLRLQRGLRVAGIAPDSFEWPPDSDPNRAPYRGWQPLQAVDAAVYFGRDAQINRALSAIRELRGGGESRPLVILGPSGVGKSSFLRAGLLPRLGRDDRHFLVMDIVRPQRLPLTGPYGLARSIHALRAGLGLAEPALGTIKSGAGDPARVRGWLVEAQGAAVARFLDNDSRPAPPTIVLPVDQAEELFGPEAGEEAGEFLTMVAGLLRDGQPGLPIVLAATVRADRYEPLQTAPQLEGLQAQLFEDLKPLPRDRYREVICGPAERAQHAGARLQWSPELVERLLTECAAGADALPLLALTLARLYEDYGDGMVGVAEYESMGGVSRIVETEMDAVLSPDPEIRRTQLNRLHDAFVPWLVTINPANDEPLRRAARWADLPAESRDLIDALVARRLLVKDERGGEVIVEVALESLLRQWDTLAGWLRDDAGDLKDTDGIEQAARAWDANARGDDWLLPGARLAGAEALAAKPGFRDRLNTAREYLLASRQREDRRTAAAVRDAREREAAARRYSRRLKAALAMVAVVAVAAVIGFGWAVKAQRDADARFRDATAQRLYSESKEMLAGQNPGGGDDVQGMQMLLAASAIRSNFQGLKDPLLGALQQQRDLLKVIPIPAVSGGVAFSPDGHRIASGSADNTVRVWDAATGQPIGEPLRGHDNAVTSVAFSPDGHRIASGSLDETVRFWDAGTGQPVGEPLRTPNGVVMTVAFSPDGRRLASGSGHTVRVWDAGTGQPIGEPLRGHDRLVSSVAFSPDGRRLASASADQTVRVWDVGTGQPIGEPLRGHNGDVVCVAFSPDGRRLASASTDMTLRLWDAATGQTIGEPLHQDGGVTGVAFSPDGRRIASANTDKTIRLWDATTSREVGVLRGHRAAVVSVAFSPDGRRLVSGGDDKTVRVWDAVSWQPMLGHEDAAVAAFFDDGRRIASGGSDSTVRWWDSATLQPIGEQVRVDDPDVRYLEALDEDRLMSMGLVNTLRVWDAHTRAPIGEPVRLGPWDPLRPLAYRKEAHRFAALTATGEVRQWDDAGMQLVGSPFRPDGIVTNIRFSKPDGRILATGTIDGVVQLWDAASGRPVGQPMKDDGSVAYIAYSRDGGLLAVSHFGGTLRLWDTRTFQPIGEPMQSESVVAVATFSPDGRTLASGSGDGSIRLWDVEHRAQLGPPLTGHTGGIISLDFSPDGTKLLSGSVDQTLRMWPVPTASPDALCDKLTHNMSRQQWNDWVSPAIDYIKVCPGLPEAADAG